MLRWIKISLLQTSDPSFTFRFPQIMQHVMKLSYCRIILLVRVICVVLPSSHKILLIKNKYFPLPPFRFCISVLSSTWALCNYPVVIFLSWINLYNFGIVLVLFCLSTPFDNITFLSTPYIQFPNISQSMFLWGLPYISDTSHNVEWFEI